jgi:5-(aminomethyl)-3-furanmethanol phosphate kinase
VRPPLGYSDSVKSTGAYQRGGRGIQDHLCDVFLKIGGSILDKDALTSVLVPHITSLSRQRRIVILPGGGQAVKRIKANQQRHAADFHSCWRPAVLNLDVNAGVLASYSQLFTVAASAEEIAACLDIGNVAVFAAAGSVFSNLTLTPDFRATTDSMGLYFATTLGARRYVIVSDVDGIYAERPEEGTSATALARLTVEELEHLPSSKLDPSFPEYLRRYPVPTVVVNGKHPTRVSEAILGDPTIGTEITLGASWPNV